MGKKDTREYINHYFPQLDEKIKLLYCCPFCRFNTEEANDIHYHIIGYHKVLNEFFNDY